MAVTVYSCLNCGASVRFDIGEKQFVCDHCDTRFSIEQMNSAYPDEDDSRWSAATKDIEQHTEYAVERTSASELESASVRSYNCPSCGAEVLDDSETQAAGYCAYCGNPVSISERLLSGDSLPSRMIPFKITRENAAAIFLSKIKRKPLLPASFMANAKRGAFTSIYIPFELFDADCSAGITAKGTNITSWSDSEYSYTKTDTYEARRAGFMSFSGVPADASDKMDDEDMQAIEPFDMAEMTAFSKKYLSGHFAEAPTTKRESMISAIFARLKPAAQTELLGTVTGYGSVSLESGNTAIERISSEYVMLPVWMMTAKHKSKDFIFAVNGQTGKFEGKLPIDWKRAGILFLLSFAIVFAAIFVGWEVWLWLFG
jgi:DNA-directed RNA polymerase subunit RPC12/RpoP